MEKKCKSCEHCLLLYYTDNEKDIEEIKNKQIKKNMKLFYRTAKDLVKTPKKLVEYVRNIDCEDTSYEPWMEGFLRTPQNEKEKYEAEHYCTVEPFEPIELENVDADFAEECSEYKKREK